MRRIEINLPASVRRACSSAIIHSLRFSRGAAKESVSLWLLLPCRTNLFGRGRRFGCRWGLNSLARQEFGQSRLFERFSFGFFLLDFVHVHQIGRDTRFACRSLVTFRENFLNRFHGISEVAHLESYTA